MASKKDKAKPETDLAPSLSKMLSGPTVKAIRKKHGDGIFMLASDFDVAPVKRIPTKVFMYDYALGGGFAVGRVNVVWGHKSSAKTTILLKALGNAQKMCANCWEFHPCHCGEYRDPICAFLDVEGTLDLPWAAKLGVDLDRMLLSVPEYAEQTLDIAEAVVRNGVDVLVLDSIAFLTPAKEIVASTADETPGMQARAMGKGTRKFVSAINTVRNERGIGPTLLFTNQVRMKVGVMFGSPETQPGGLATGFASTIEVKHRAGGYDMDDVLGQPISAEFHFRCEKNKSARAKMEGSFKLALMDTDSRKIGDPLSEHDMVVMGEKVGLVEGHGSSWTALGTKFKGKGLIEKELIANEEFHTKMWNALMLTLLAG